MGYVHDVSLSVMVPLDRGYLNASGWTLVKQVSDVWEYLKNYAAETFTITVPVGLPASAKTKRGCKLVSVDFWYEVGTQALVSIAAAVQRFTLPADGAAGAPPVEASCTAAGASLLGVGVHMASYALDDSFWLQPGEVCRAVLTVETAAPTEFYYFGARLNFTLRE